MRFELLGPVQFQHDGRIIEVRRKQERSLLCVLLLEPGRAVSTERLLDLLWDGDPPESGRATLHTYVARLRQSLGSYGVRVLTRGGGYLVDVAPDSVDVHRFQNLLGQAQQLPDPAARLPLLSEALGLWRGPFMADVTDGTLRERIGSGLAEQRVTAVELQAEAQLALGQHHQAADTLSALISAHPERETIVELLMTALYRCGRKTDALAAYRELRRHLANELGLEPGPRVQSLHQRILNDDPELELASTSRGSRQFLPWAVPDFTGRSRELRRLDELSRERTSAGTVLISAIGGIGGVGKTALAVHWAKSAASQYPDGQLYVNLRGYDPRQPMPPIEALGVLLRALGKSAQEVPAEVEEAAALYRSLIADLKVLVLLDNAGSADQVRPLLPNGKDNFVLVTSRDSLAGLIARDGARRLTLEVLPLAEAVELLGQILGVDRVRAEAQAAAELAGAAGYLPLALRIAAANLADRPNQTLAGYVAELKAVGRLDSLAVEGDADSAIRAVFDHSYRALAPALQRLFRLLGTIPGPDVTVEAATALSGLEHGEVASLLAQLCDAHLLTQADGRYSMHDLLKLFALELSRTERQEALHRLLDHYIGAAAAADLVLRSYRVLSFEPPAYKVDFASELEALAWFEKEGANLVAAVRVCEPTHPAHCWQLVSVLPAWLERRRSAAEWHEVAAAGARGAEAAGDAEAAATINALLIPSLYYLRRIEEAEEIAERVVRLRRQIADPLKLGIALYQWGAILSSLDRNEDAVNALLESVSLLKPLPDSKAMLGKAYNNLGWAHHVAERHEEAIICYQEAADLGRSTGNPQSVSFAEGNLGRAYEFLGRHDLRLRHWTRAAEAGAEAGDQRLEANSWEHMGRACLALGDIDQARHHLQKALSMFREIDDGDEIAAMETLLESLPVSP